MGEKPEKVIEKIRMKNALKNSKARKLKKKRIRIDKATELGE